MKMFNECQCHTRLRVYQYNFLLHSNEYLINGLQGHPVHGLDFNDSLLLRVLDECVCRFAKDLNTFSERKIPKVPGYRIMHGCQIS